GPDDRRVAPTTELEEHLTHALAPAVIMTVRYSPPVRATGRAATSTGTRSSLRPGNKTGTVIQTTRGRPRCCFATRRKGTMFGSWHRPMTRERSIKSRARARLRSRPHRFTPRLEALEERTLLSNSIPLNTNTWTAMGPAPIVNGQIPGGGPVSGRITDLIADPTDASGNTIFIATAGGGVWKTSNAKAANPPVGPLTNSVVDGAGKPVALFTGSIGLLPSNPRIMYVGTGESNLSIDSYYGRGVLRTTDGGETWTLSSGPNGVFNRMAISK